MDNSQDASTTQPESTDARTVLANLGPIGLNTMLDIITLTLDPQEHLALFRVVVRHINRGPLTIKKTGQRVQGLFFRLEVLDARPKDKNWNLVDLGQRPQLTLTSLDEYRANKLGFPVPCLVRWLNVNPKTNKYEPVLGMPSMRIACIKYTRKEDRQYFGHTSSSDERDVTYNAKDSVIITVAGTIRDFDRRLLFQSMRSRVTEFNGRKWCEIPELNVWLLASDAKMLATCDHATLKTVHQTDRTFVHFESCIKNREMEKWRQESKIKLILPDGRSITKMRNEIRDSMVGKPEVQDADTTYKSLPGLHGYLDVRSVSDIISSPYNTFHLQENRNFFFKLAHDWKTRVPSTEIYLHQIQSIGRTADIPNYVVLREFLERHEHLPSMDTMQDKLAVHDRRPLTEDDWRLQEAGTTRGTQNGISYIDYVWSLATPLEWLQWLTDVTDS